MTNVLLPTNIPSGDPLYPIKWEIELGLRKIQGLLEAFEESLGNELQRLGLEIGTALLPGALWLERALEQALADLSETWSTFGSARSNIHQYFEQRGDPWRLWEVRKSWSGGGEGSKSVVGLVSSLVEWPTLNHMLVDNYWTDHAADAYKETLPSQQAALIALKNRAQEIGNILDAFADALLGFWNGVSFAVAQTVGELVGAIVGLVSPTIAEQIGEIIKVLSTSVGSLLEKFVDAYKAFISSVGDLESSQADNEGFERGRKQDSREVRWPRPGEAIPTDRDAWELKADG